MGPAPFVTTPSPAHGLPLPVVDLRERLLLGRLRGEHLLTDEERRTLDRVLALEGAPALLHARLAARRPTAFRLPDLRCAGVEDVEGAAAPLVDAGLASFEVSWEIRRVEAVRGVLAAGCARLGLPRAGTRAALAERLVGHEGWDDAAWLRLTCARLVLRLERWATLQVEPDRSVPVLDRLGRRRWVEHPVTGGGLVPDRATWDAWEALVDGWETLPPDERVRALDATWPPGGLDLRRALRASLRDDATRLERAGHRAEALALLDALVARPGARADDVVRAARLLERQGRTAEALARLEEARDADGGGGRHVLGRAGRALARRVGKAWRPDPPLLRPVERWLALGRAEPSGTRPRYGADATTVEAAVADVLAASGRRALLAEGALWRTVAGLLLVDVLFLPVPAQLPAPRLRGPLDAWTPAFASRRAGAVFEVLDDVRAGGAAARLRAAWERHEGAAITGVDWTLAEPEALVALVDGLGPEGLLAILHPLLAEGRRAASGLPDLAVLPGPATSVPGLHPGRLPSGVLLVEVKGEQDTERDAQQVWFDRLRRAGVEVELWRVRAPA